MVLSIYAVNDSTFCSVLSFEVHTLSTPAFIWDKASCVEYKRSSSGFFTAVDLVRIRVPMRVAIARLGTKKN